MNIVTKATIDDVAALAGVSMKTVSRVVNNEPNVRPATHEKVEAAFKAGCRRFDGALKGIGGCPMAKDELVGNMPTEQLINFMAVNKIKHNLNLLHFESAYNKAKDIFKF